MANFYIQKSDISSDKAIITGEEAKHISRVLRMKKGDAVTLCDGEGMFYDAVLSDFNSDSVTADITDKYPAPTEPKTKITLFQGIPKNPKLETIVQKATEIGVVRIVPVNTVRAVAKLDKKEKTERLRKIAREAAKQSHRGVAPKITDAVSFRDAVAEAAKAELAVIPYEEETEVSLKSVLGGKNVGSVAIMIGPEGGFEKSEVLLALENKIIPVTLGKRILRTETAGLAVASMVLYESDDMQ